MDRFRSVRAWSPISRAPNSSADRSARPERNSLARWLFKIVEALGPYLASSWVLSCQTVTSWIASAPPLVIPDGPQLDALPPGRRGQHVQITEGGAVARLIQEQPQPRRQHPIRRDGGLLLGGGHHLLGNCLEQGSEEPLLVGRGVQVDGVVPTQEVVQIQVVAVGGGAPALAAVDGQG